MHRQRCSGGQRRKRSVYVCMGSFRWNRGNRDCIVRRHVHLYNHGCKWMYRYTFIHNHATTGTRDHRHTDKCFMQWLVYRQCSSNSIRRNRSIHVFMGSIGRNSGNSNSLVSGHLYRNSNGRQRLCYHTHVYDYATACPCCSDFVYSGNLR